jgi:hypothetical protein
MISEAMLSAFCARWREMGLPIPTSLDPVGQDAFLLFINNPGMILVVHDTPEGHKVGVRPQGPPEPIEL